jgi:isopentenyldiphosphate isomerase
MARQKFIPKPGQVDFTNIRRCPVINCVVQFKEKILLVKRSSDMNYYPNVWHGIAGFLDDNLGVENKVREELRGELGLTEKNIVSIKLGDAIEVEAPQYNKTWIINTVLAVVNTDKVQLDWEAQEYIWVKPNEVIRFDLLPGFEKVIGMFFTLK